MNTDLTADPTPRTDAMIGYNGMINAVAADFARGLERELLAAHKTAEELSGALREEQLKTQKIREALANCSDALAFCQGAFGNKFPSGFSQKVSQIQVASMHALTVSALTGGAAD